MLVVAKSLFHKTNPGSNKSLETPFRRLLSFAPVLYVATSLSSCILVFLGPKYPFLLIPCVAPCSDPGKPVGGRRIGTNFRHGKKVRFICMESLKIQGPKRIICFDGVWSDKKPVCLPPSQVKGKRTFPI